MTPSAVRAHLASTGFKGDLDEAEQLAKEMQDQVAFGRGLRKLLSGGA